MSQSDVQKVTFSGRPKGVNFEHCTKRISAAIFSVLVHQMCLLDTKKLIIAFSFSFVETS